MTDFFIVIIINVSGVLEEEDNKACLDEQPDLCEEIIDISDEDDVPQTSMTPESTNLPTISLLPNLVADYESEGDGKYIILFSYFFLNAYISKIVIFYCYCYN